jgi:adenine C2-methylase RlmN of 23S rRNA A2503 and tRNA A37
MARGEPLANPTITETSTDLLLRLGRMANDRNLPVKFNISTIMPLTMRKSLVEMFPMIHPTIYYSVYSTDKSFRDKWLPGALPVGRALEMLAEYQNFSRKIIKFHGAFIRGQNDHDKDINALMSAISSHGIRGEFNVVRYNPFSVLQGEESPHVDMIAQMISQYMPCKVIPRVGIDVYSSCGQFVPKKEE